MTPARFPHSDTPGSTLGCQLPRAYRRLLRPSSALDAKASTMRPSQLVTTKPHKPTRKPADPQSPTMTRHKEPQKACTSQSTSTHHTTNKQNKQNNPPRQRPHQPTGRHGHTRGEPFRCSRPLSRSQTTTPHHPTTPHTRGHSHGREGSYTRHQPTQLIPQNPNSVPTDTPHTRDTRDTRDTCDTRDTRGGPWLSRFVLPHLQVTPSTPGHLWSQTGACSLERR
jgi:hypothetical protein